MTRIRPTWDDYFAEIAHLVATRSTCDRAHVGALLVRHNRLISAGYNGSPPGAPHCDDEGHILVYDHCRRVIHAEVNALTNALAPVYGATLYVTRQPCADCARELDRMGVRDVRVVAATEAGRIR